MRHRDETEYQAKVIDDTGLTRSRVPSPLLNAMGAHPGDYLIFHLIASGEVKMRISRSKATGRQAQSKKPAMSGKKRAGKRG